MCSSTCATFYQDSDSDGFGDSAVSQDACSVPTGYVSDATDWWNIYAWRDGAAVSVCPMDAEFAGPMWVFGQSSYDFLPGGAILCTYIRDGRC